MELSDLVGRAQEAMDRGEYRLVVASCSHALETYPTCVSLHRMLGEAHLEQGETEPAIEHFERVLSLDPLNVYVRLGLGVAFEERSDPRGAYTHYLHAWELNPALDQLRDELLRLRTVLGASGCLHPTRAGLAAIYARGGRLSRAAAEWRAVLATDGENSWARMALAEVLWRQGDDAGAATACLAGLRDAPENVRALAILAEIERRKQGLNARTYTDQYRAIDPIGDVVHGIVESRPGADFSFLAVDHAFVEEFDFDQVLDDAPAALGLEEVAGAATPAAIRHSSQMGAPDLWDSLVKDLEHDKTAVISPFSWTDDSGAAGSGSAAVEAELSLDDLLTSDAPAPPLATGAMEAEPLSTAASVELDDESRSLAEPGFDEAQHIEAGALLEAPAVYAGMAIAQEALVSSPPVEVSEEPPAAASSGSEVGRGYTAYLSDIEPFSFEPADEAAYSDADPLAFAPEDGPGLAADAFAAPESGADLAVEPMELAETVAPEPDPELVLEPARANVEQFITADGRVDLTVGWDDLDRTLQEATPALGAVAGFDGLLAELDAGGIAPFDLLAPTSDDSTWEPFGDDDFASPAPVALPVDPVALVAVAPAAAVESGVSPTLEAADTPEDPAGESWTLLEEELASAIPDDLTSGYTEVFRSLDEFERLEPYVSSPEETVIHAPVAPDSVGEPLEFDDLLSVTSQDLTALLDERDVANADVDFGPVDVDPLSVAPAPAPDPAEFDWEAALEPDVAQFTAPVLSQVFGEENAFIAQNIIEEVEAPETATILAVHSDSIEGDERDLQIEEQEDDAEAVNEIAQQVSDFAGEDWPAWPAFIGAFGESEEQRCAAGGIFAQMREEKDARVSAGTIHVDRRLSEPAPPARRTPLENGFAEKTAAPSPSFWKTSGPGGGGEDAAHDMANLHDQLRRGEVTAADVAALLESMTANGEASPLALRVLGEAYLELGRTDQAVLLLRRAMAMRTA